MREGAFFSFFILYLGVQWYQHVIAKYNPMDTQEIIFDEFLRHFKIVVNTAFAYPVSHPYFLKAVDVFVKQATSLLQEQGSISIGFTNANVVIKGKVIGKGTTFFELAQLFYHRKIKMVELKKDLTAKELTLFLSKLCLPAKEIVQQGGMQAVLGSEMTPHLVIEDIDFSSFLQEGGAEIKDVWLEALKKALQKPDSEALEKLADDFAGVLHSIDDRQMIENQPLQEQIADFLAALKAKDKARFELCAKEALRWVVTHALNLQGPNLKKISLLLRELQEDDFVEFLKDDILTNEKFDFLSFQLISVFVSKEKHAHIAQTFATQFNHEFLRDHQQTRKRLKDILSLTEDQFSAGIYRNALAKLLDQAFVDEGMSFERERLSVNYRYILLALCMQEKDAERLTLVINKLEQAVKEAIEFNDLDYIADALHLLEQKRHETKESQTSLGGVDTSLKEFIERSVLEGRVSEEYVKLCRVFKESALGVDVYLQKIFAEHRVSRAALEFFLIFFPSEITRLQENLKSVSNDVEFLEMFIAAFKDISHPAVADILTDIYALASPMMKVDVLKAMQNMAKPTTGFFLSILKGDDALVKKESLRLLMKDAQTSQEAAAVLFTIHNPFGTRNALVLQNLLIAEELMFKAAEPFVRTLSQTRSIFKLPIRRAALALLEQWGR
ncbi:MAG: hypothetical protein KBA46_04250 [Candidatus Omnitrophica bacterium]|nr:hypothetical protein [Candidatus Omnitrophota bacterium]